LLTLLVTPAALMAIDHASKRRRHWLAALRPRFFSTNATGG
jgi:hypothetical protein